MTKKTDIEQLTISLLQEEIDEKSLRQVEPQKWQQIYQTFLHNPACLIIFSHLKNRNLLDVLPHEIKENWQRSYYNNLKRNILVLEQVKEFKSLLRERNIEFIALKGLSLFSTVYKDLGTRSFTDLDILVRKNDLPVLKDVFGNLGYALIKKEKIHFLEKFGQGELLFKKEGLPHFDVHWDLSFYERFRNIIRFDNDKIWQEARKIKFEDTDITVLSPETQIIHISAHLTLAHHFWNLKLLGYYDIFTLIKFYKDEINWDKLINDVRDIRIKIPVFYALKFVEKLFGITLPDNALIRLRPSRFRLMMLKNIIRGNTIIDKTSQYKKTHYFGQTLMMDRPWDIIKVAWRGIFPSKEWLMYRYSRKYSLSLRMKHILKLANLFIKFLYYLTFRRLLDIVKKMYKLCANSIISIQ